MTMPPSLDELTTMLNGWLWRRPLGLPQAMDQEAVEVPSDLLATVTSKEPYRSRVLEDASIWLAIPICAGIGLEAILEPTPEVLPFEDWEKSIAPLRFEANWSRDMTGRETEGFAMEIRRVCVEEGAWKIVELWDIAERGRAIEELRALREMLGRRPGA